MLQKYDTRPIPNIPHIFRRKTNCMNLDTTLGCTTTFPPQFMGLWNFPRYPKVYAHIRLIYVSMIKYSKNSSNPQGCIVIRSELLCCDINIRGKNSSDRESLSRRRKQIIVAIRRNKFVYLLY